MSGSARPERLKIGGLPAAGAALLTLAGTYLRLRGLGSYGFWRDEAQCLFIAQKEFPAGIVQALLHEAHPPLYYVLQHFWMPLAGWGEFRVRFLSAMFGILLVPLLYLVGRRLFGPWAGLAAALWGAVAPLHVVVSQTARMYSLLALLALLSLWLLVEAWQRGGWWWAGYALVALAMLYTHNWGLLLWACQNGFVLWMWVRRRPAFRRLLPWLGSQMAVGLLYLPWFLILLRQLPIIAVLPFVPVPSPGEKLAQLASDLLAPWPMGLLWLALLGWGLVPAKAQPAQPQEGMLGAVLFSSFGVLFLGLLVSLGTYGQVPSYVTMAAFPALCLLFGRGLAGIRPAWLSLPLGVLLVVFSLQALPRAQFMFRSTLREVAAAIEERAGPADVILIAPDYLATTFNMYYHGSQPQIAFPWTMGRLEEIDCVGWNERWRRAAEAVPATLEEVEERLDAGGRLWFITALDEFPDDEAYYGQVRRLKRELDAHYMLMESIKRFRGGMEWADIYVYRRRSD
ncbi:MAG: glycosyltransferase family 39 protein [Anaerolineae bacterium]